MYPSETDMPEIWGDIFDRIDEELPEDNQETIDQEQAEYERAEAEYDLRDLIDEPCD